jgi:hypothetical protein
VIPPEHERPLLPELPMWWCEQADRNLAADDTPHDLAADEVGRGGFVFSRIKRAPSCAEAAAAIAGLTREQLEAVVLAAACEWRQADDMAAYFAWGGIPARTWGAVQGPA